MFSLHCHLIFFIALIIYQSIQEKKAEITFDKNPATVFENEPIGTVITTATDDIFDLKDPHASIMLDTVDGFDINTNTGHITTTKIFNFELEPKVIYQLQVELTATNHSDTKFLQVFIKNVNEPPKCEEPGFVAGTASVDVAENVDKGTFVYRIKAEDEDVADILKYKIESQNSFPANCENIFSIDQTSGCIFVNSALDYDAGFHKCRLTIQVEDQHNLFCRGALTINVRDLNDEPPVFKKGLKDTVHVLETEPVETIIAKVEALDRDKNDTVTYRFARTVDMFNVDESASTTIPEDFPASEAVYRIIVDDPDLNEAIKFTVINDQNEAVKYFRLDTKTGVISKTDQLLDYDNGVKQYKMIISVTEGKVPSKSCTGTITINIQNINDESPIYINAPTVINVNDNQAVGTIIAKFTATDHDVDDKVFYEFASSHKGFALDEDTGELKLVYRADYEDTTFPHVQILEIRAYDTGRVHSVTAAVTINIIDINDNAPQCSPTLYTVVLAETNPPGTSVASLNCRDDDLKTPNNLLTYTMALDAFSAGRFVNQKNEISVGPKGLDYDNLTFEGLQFKHTIMIKISDGGTPSLTSTATLIVQVTRKNEWKPKSPDDTFTVPENSPIGTIVGVVKFTDADVPLNSIKYSITGGNDGIPPKFYMEPNTGQLKLLNLLDAETTGRYSLIVQAVDLNNDIASDPLKQKTSFTTVTVDILNVNDEPPICNPAYYETTIYSTIKDPFLQLHCSDKDSTSNQLSYVIVGGNTNNRFKLQRINFNPPSVATTQSFQFDSIRGIQDPNDYQLLVQVTDELDAIKAHQLTTTATVVVHVIPWTTTQPTTATPTTPFTTAVLVLTSTYWNPDGWFVALLVITGLLALGALYGLAWALFKTHPKCIQFFPKCKKPVKTPLTDVTGSGRNHLSNSSPVNKEASSETKSPILSDNVVKFPEQFDGRAVDIVSGKAYLFNSQTGQTRWVN
ncbi:cadherin-related family member 3-like isoform X2 [Mustelus asterias]